MSATLSTVSDGISKMLRGMRQRERAMQGYLNRNVLEQYRNIQRERWMTEGKSEGGVKWTRLNAAYARRKRKIYAQYEGAGTKMLIATGKLFKSVIGPGEGFRKVVTPTRLYLATTVDYASYVNEARNFSTLGPESEHEIKQGIAQFLFKGILKQSRELL